MKESDFISRLASISPTIEYIGGFSRAKDRVNVKCKQCGYEWSPRGTELLTGRGCRKCKYNELAKRSRRTPVEFVQEMSIINPTIKILGKYTTSREHVQVECINCGRQWAPCASSLLSGSGCPSCSRKRRQ